MFGFINWNLSLDPAVFYNELKESRQLAVKAAVDKTYFTQLDRMEKTFRTATPSGQSLLLEQLRALRRMICAKGLDRYK